MFSIDISFGENLEVSRRGEIMEREEWLERVRVGDDMVRVRS